MSELVEADESVADAGGEPVGTLRVSVPVTYARIVLGPHLSAFLDAYPRVSLDLVVSDAFLDLAADRLDVAVRIGVPTQDPGLIVRKVMDNRRVVVASRAYLERMGIPTAPADLAAHHCLRFPYRQGRQSWVFTREGHTEKVGVNGRLTANSLDILREGVLNGQGIALVPTWLVQDDLVAGEMLSLFDAWSVQPVTGDAQVYAAYLPNRRHSRKVQTFVAFLAERVRGALAE